MDTWTKSELPEPSASLGVTVQRRVLLLVYEPVVRSRVAELAVPELAKLREGNREICHDRHDHRGEENPHTEIPWILYPGGGFAHRCA